MFLNLVMPRNRLANARLRILIPIVPPAMPEKNAALLLDAADQIETFHAIGSSAT